jgi:hypothetical protein
MKRRMEMKQIIVMIAMILLGITIAGFIGDFSGSAERISDNANDKILQITSSGAI